MKRSLLRTLRAVRGWTQAEAAERLGISRGYLSRLEHGRRMSSAVKKAVGRVFRIRTRLLDAGVPISSSFYVVPFAERTPRRSRRGVSSVRNSG